MKWFLLYKNSGVVISEKAHDYEVEVVPDVSSTESTLYCVKGFDAAKDLALRTMKSYY